MDARLVSLSCLLLLIAASCRAVNKTDCSSLSCQSTTCIENSTGAWCNSCPNNRKVGAACNTDNPCRDCSEGYCFVSIREEGFTNHTCLNPCASQPCEHNGVCNPGGPGGFTCNCPKQWKGRMCEKDVNECESSPCLNQGTCTNFEGGFVCYCLAAFSGVYCDVNVDDCADSPCLHGGTCEDLVGSYRCWCPPSRAGLKCQLENLCMSNPCGHQSSCFTSPSGNYSCECQIGWKGKNCDEDVDECHEVSQGICEQGGKCHNTQGSYRCECLPGLGGDRCDRVLEKCSPNPCGNGGTCLTKQYDFQCLCLPGFSGDTCNESSACEGVDCNGAECTFSNGEYRCICPANTTGQYCEYDLNGRCLKSSCSSPGCPHSLCKNGGRCAEGSSDKCTCPPGYSGDVCQSVNACISSPCSTGGSCTAEDSGRGYTCDCKPGFTGENCEKFSVCGAMWPCSNGGTCQDANDSFVCDCPISWKEQNCTTPACEMCKCCKSSGNCLDVCKLSACSSIDQECKNFGLGNPYKKCPNSELCTRVFKDGQCNKECNMEECLYDGFDCKAKALTCPNETYCRPKFEDGRCDKPCYNVMCMWDGMDCDRERDTVEGVIKMKLYVGREVFEKKLKEFLYDISYRLTCMVTLLYQDGQPVIVDVTIPGFGVGVEVWLKLVRMPAGDSCFSFVDSAGDFMKKVSQNENITDFPVYDISTGQDPAKEPEGPPNAVFIVIGAIFCLLIVVLLVGIWVKKRKKVDKTWFPPGFSHNKARMRSSTDQMSSGSEKQIIEGSDSFSEESFCAGSLSRMSKMDFPGDMSCSMASSQIPISHMNPIMCPQAPMGYNHQMNNYFAANNFRPQMGVQMIQDDIYSKIYNEAIRNYDQTGETPLHLAARYSRADAAQKFLREGADPNVQDHDGKTPLHAAIAADAVGVFQILLRCGTCSVNVQSKDGTTPLICAVRLAIDGMVGDLIKAEADLNKTDDQGKTGLHWAAAVNNLDAAILLLHHGGLNRDAQDDKGQTPLFLAAKEGSFNVAQLLLHNSASMDLADQLDRLPRDIAIEKRHFDIVKLLDEYMAKASQNRGQSNFSDHLLMSDGAKSAKQKNKSSAQHDQDGSSSVRSKKKRKIDMTDVMTDGNNQAEMFASNFQQNPRHLEGPSSYGCTGGGPSNIDGNRMYNILHSYRQNQSDFVSKDHHHHLKSQKAQKRRGDFNKWFVGSTGSSPNDSDFAVIQSPNEGSSGSPGYCNNAGVFLSPPEADHYQQQHMLTTVAPDGVPRCVPASVIQRYHSNPVPNHSSQLAQTSYGMYDEAYNDRVVFSKPSGGGVMAPHHHHHHHHNNNNKQNPPLVFQQYPTPPSQQFSPNGMSSAAQAGCLNSNQRENLFETPSPGAGDEWVDISMTSCMEPNLRQQLDNVMPNESSVC